MSDILTPLRYPGGKSKLSEFFKRLFEQNNLVDSTYVEPYAGGAGVAIALLFSGHAKRIILNDISYPIFCFWWSSINNPEYMVKRIREAPLNLKQWKKEKSILANSEKETMESIGFSFFYLNRTNRSGIIRGGVIGGQSQDGNYKIDARFNRLSLAKKIESIADFKSKISLHNQDAKEFIAENSTPTKQRLFFYLDPPYYVKGQRLYTNFYKPKDHEEIGNLVKNNLKASWVVTYDNAPEIKKIYKGCPRKYYNLKYSAFNYCEEKEIMLHSSDLTLPTVKSKLWV